MRSAVHYFAALGTALLFAAGAVAQESMRVRGTIERVEAGVLHVKARDGSDLTVQLTDDAVTVALVKASLADIKAGTFVGVTGLPQPDGTQKAVEVHIFPESMRGTGEGHRPWDLRPQSTMTNASVDQVVTGVDGHTLRVKYKEGEKTIVVGADTPVVTYLPGTRDELKPGTKIFIPAASRQPDGTLRAQRISFGRNGLTPPM